MPENGIELVASKRYNDVKEVATILTEAEVPFQASDPGKKSSRIKYFLSVDPNDYPRAREALDHSYQEIPLPNDHHLHTATESDLREILTEPLDWNHFDVAHARRIAAEKGMEIPAIEKDIEQHRDSARRKYKYAPIAIALVIMLVVIRFLVKILAYQ